MYGEPLALSALVFVASMGATYAFWHYQRADGEAVRRAAFETRIDETVHHVGARLRQIEDMLRGVAGFVATSPALTPEKFHEYLAALRLLERRPEILGVGVAVLSPTGTRASTSPDQVVPLAHEAQPHAIVRYVFGVAPLPLGEDLYARPVRREAMDRAMDMGSPAMTASIRRSTGVDAASDRVEIYLPLAPAAGIAVSGDAHPAWLFADVSPKSMMQALLADDLSHAATNVDVVLHDGPPAQQRPPFAQPVDRAGSRLTALRRVSFGGRDWGVEVRARPGFRAAREDRHPVLLASIAAACSLLMTGLTWVLATGRMRAQRAAARMNEELIRSEARLLDLNDALENRVVERTAQLKAVAERLTLAVATANTGLWDWNLVTHEVHYSPEWCAQLGLPPREARATIDSWENRLHPEDRERGLAALREHLEKPGSPWEIELRFRHEGGSYRTILARSCAYADASGKMVRVIGSHLDITERKQVEDARVALTLELRQVWRQLSKVEEADRRWLAGELHDSIGSALTALNLNLTIIQERLPNDAAPALHARLVDSIGLLEETVETVRGLMAQLRPPVLDDYGLATALRWYGENVAARADLRVSFRLSGKDMRFPPETEITLFRIAQGALTNVVKHARAKEVSIAMEIAADKLTIAIADDGRGFTPNAQHADTERPHWGLVTMRERAQSLDGQCSIESAPGGGTRVLVKVPIPSP